MTTARIALTVLAVALLGLLWTAVFQVDQRQTALVVHFGEVSRVVKDPGLHLKWPIADEIVDVENRIFMWSSDNMAVQVSDKKQYLVDTVTFVRISDPQKFRETVGADQDIAKQRIDTRLNAALRQTYGKRTFVAALSADRDVMMQEIRDQVRPEAQTLGIEIVDVRIRRTDLMKEVLDATFDRMKSERLIEAQDLRSTGEAQKVRMMAEADRKVLEIVSEGDRQSEIIRGAGEAQRASTFAAAYEKDPEFYAFYRSLQAYGKSMGQGGTSLVLSPDSEFFRYFKNENGAVPQK